MKKYLFFLAIGIIFFIATNILITSLLWLVKLSITPCNFVISLSLTLILLILLHKKILTIKEILINLGVLIIIIVCSLIISNYFYDNTYDGNNYHKSAVGSMKGGWNPFYESIEEFNETADIKLHKLSEATGIWNDHYAKGYWMYAANVYSVTNNIESGKSIYILIIIATILLSLSALSYLFNHFITTILALLIAFNPILMLQMFSYYNDGLGGNLLFILIINLILLCLNKETRNLLLLMFISLLIILINIKFTTFAFCAIISTFFYIYILINKNLRVSLAKKMFFCSVIAVVIGVLLVGYPTYVKNTIEHGHPFYPIYGTDKIDIISSQGPSSFKDKSNIEKFFLANYSRSENIWWADDKEVTLKIPFTFTKEELGNMATYDLRIGGYGVLFSGILSLSIPTLTIGLYLLFKKKRELFWLFFLPSVTILSMPLYLDNLWWARYYPILYGIPILGIIVFLLQKKNSYFISAFILIGLILINNLFIILATTSINIIDNKLIRDLFKEIKEECQDNRLYIYTDCQGTIYNYYDKGCKVVNLSTMPNYEKKEASHIYRYYKERSNE